ncbi:MAG: hypothetical protein M3R08_06965, partial [Bacteroidota bacterium]|nr:hypothetical protein [Bacteroidota bacterium]
MKLFYFFVFTLVFFNSTTAQTAIDWQSRFGGSDWDSGQAIRQTADSGYIMVGYSFSNNNGLTNNGNQDFYVVKMDATGQLQWQNNIGGAAQDNATDVQQTPDGGYIVVGRSMSNNFDMPGNQGASDIRLVKLDASGEVVWQRNYGSTAFDDAKTILVTNDNGFMIMGGAGAGNGDVTGHHGNLDAWILKLDDEGNIEWDRAYGGSAADFGRDIKATSDGGFILLGTTSSTDGDVSCGSTDLRMWVVKVDSAGTIQWDLCYGSPLGNMAHEIQQTADGGYIGIGLVEGIGGDVTEVFGGRDIWIFKLDSAGGLLWERSIGATGDDQGHSITETVDGGYIAVGEYFEDADSDSGYGVFKLDSSGVVEWSEFLDLGTNAIAKSVIDLTNGDLVVAGQGDPAIPPSNGMDFWVLKLTTEFNNITGKVFVDLDSDGVHNANEPALTNHTIHETTSDRFTLSDLNGDYDLVVLGSGTFPTSPAPLTHYSAVPASHTITFSGINEVDANNDFAFQPDSMVHDLKIDMIPASPFRPGTSAFYNVHYKNVGSLPTSGSVILILDTLFTFLDAAITPTADAGDSIIWDLPELTPFEMGNFMVEVLVDSAAVLGTIAYSHAIMQMVEPDAIPDDNTSSWPVTITAAYDPNDIQVNLATILIDDVPSAPWLDYLIRFQNTGNDTAFTVKIKDPLTDLLDHATFEFLGSSHPVETSYNAFEKNLWFEFDNILLPDSNTNEAESHGYVRYRMRPRTDLLVGDLIENQVGIYFDLNTPVMTNTAETEVVLITEIADVLSTDLDLALFPNPTTGELTVNFTLESTAPVRIDLFSSTGQLLTTVSAGQRIAGTHSISFSTEQIPPGIHHLR